MRRFIASLKIVAGRLRSHIPLRLGSTLNFVKPRREEWYSNDRSSSECRLPVWPFTLSMYPECNFNDRLNSNLAACQLVDAQSDFPKLSITNQLDENRRTLVRSAVAIITSSITYCCTWSGTCTNAWCCHLSETGLCQLRRSLRSPLLFFGKRAARQAASFGQLCTGQHPWWPGRHI